MELYPKHEKSKDQNRIKSGSSKNKTSVVDVVDKTDCRADGPVQTQLGSLQLQDYAAVAVHNAASVDQVSDFVNEEEVTVVANPTDIDGDTEDMENPAPQAPGWKFYPDPSHDSLEDEEYAHREDNLFLNELEQENKSYDRDIEQSTIDMGEDENTQSEILLNGAAVIHNTPAEEIRAEIEPEDNDIILGDKDIDEGNDLSGGWPYEFVDEVTELLLCTICYLPLREPMQVVGCGHSYCKSCLDQVLRQLEPKCPLCQEPMAGKEVFPDARCKRQIMNLNVKCPNAKRGCSWALELFELEKHRSVCPLEAVKCSNLLCVNRVRRKDLELHSNKQCEWRTITCPHCHEKVILHDLENHVQTKCQQYPVQCPNGCEIILEKRLIEDHVQQRCKLTVVPCPFLLMGCQFKTKRKDMMFHLSESLQNHLSTLCQRLLSLEKASEEDGTKDEESSKTQLDAVEKYRAAFESVKEQLIKTQSVVKTLSQEVTDKVAMLRDDSIERIGEAYSEIQSISSTIDEIEAKQPSLFTSRNTKKIPFVWVVKDFSKLFEKSKQTRGFCYTSEPFFTGRFGYKLVARVYPNGVADGIGNYLSLVVVVMPGPYDMLLPWPIKNRVRLRAVNLGDRKKDKVTVVVFPQTGGSCQKPTSPKGNIGLGAIKFLGHGDVESEKFVIDDTMVFKIEVDYHSANI